MEQPVDPADPMEFEASTLQESGLHADVQPISTAPVATAAVSPSCPTPSQTSTAASLEQHPQPQCCVCYTITNTFTPCAHPLCADCCDRLEEPLCPLCRRDLPHEVDANGATAAQLSSVAVGFTASGSVNISAQRRVPMVTRRRGTDARLGGRRSRSMGAITGVLQHHAGRPDNLPAVALPSPGPLWQPDEGRLPRWLHRSCLTVGLLEATPTTQATASPVERGIRRGNPKRRARRPAAISAPGSSRDYVVEQHTEEGFTDADVMGQRTPGAASSSSMPAPAAPAAPAAAAAEAVGPAAGAVETEPSDVASTGSGRSAPQTVERRRWRVWSAPGLPNASAVSAMDAHQIAAHASKLGQLQTMTACHKAFAQALMQRARHLGRNSQDVLDLRNAVRELRDVEPFREDASRLLRDLDARVADLVLQDGRARSRPVRGRGPNAGVPDRVRRSPTQPQPAASRSQSNERAGSSPPILRQENDDAAQADTLQPASAEFRPTNRQAPVSHCDARWWGLVNEGNSVARVRPRSLSAACLVPHPESAAEAARLPRQARHLEEDFDNLFRLLSEGARGQPHRGPGAAREVVAGPPAMAPSLVASADSPQSRHVDATLTE